MEIFSTNCKIILLSRGLNKVIIPIQSRCLKIRCSLTKKEDLIQRFNNLDQEFKLHLSQIQKNKIIIICNLNFETLYLIIDMIYNFKIPIEDISIPENKIITLVNIICNSKSIKELMEFKDLLTKIIVDNIDLNELIINTLTLVLKKNLSNEQKRRCINEACICDKNILKSSKDIFHLELYFIKIYQIINDQTLRDKSSK